VREETPEEREWLAELEQAMIEQHENEAIARMADCLEVAIRKHLSGCPPEVRARSDWRRVPFGRVAGSRACCSVWEDSRLRVSAKSAEFSTISYRPVSGDR
jgi:hypothetical protein